MRLVNYKVRTPAEQIITTTSYREAMTAGNLIEEVFFTEVNELTKEQIKDRELQKEKIRNAWMRRKIEKTTK